jgi:hypothetical protein
MKAAPLRKIALSLGFSVGEIKKNKNFWQEIICLLSLQKLTVNNLVAMFTMEHKQSKRTAEQGSPNNVEHQ